MADVKFANVTCKICKANLLFVLQEQEGYIWNPECILKFKEIWIVLKKEKKI
jgi:hypothetical protein